MSAAVVLPLAELSLPETAARATPSSDIQAATLEAWSDTMIPGEKRWAGDRAIAGAAAGPGAVQAGALTLMHFAPMGLEPALPALVVGLNTEATRYAAEAGVPLDPTVPPFVSLPFRHRTALALELLDKDRPDQLAWYALSAVAFLAFHTAGHLHTANAVRSGHPGLKWIGFPHPDADGLWRFPEFSYRRELARLHPHTTRSGNPE
jgi:hypothetical protein